MNKIHKIREKVLKINFRRFFKWFLPLAIVIVLLGGLAAGFGLRTQISKTISYHQQMERVHGYDEENRGEYEKDAASIMYHDQKHEADEFFEGPLAKDMSSGMKVVLGAYGGICLLLFAAYWLATAAWLYKKAVLSKMNGLLWMIMGLLGNILAAALFLLVRSFIRQKCAACGHWQKPKRWFCTDCGAEMNRNCLKCGELCDMEATYCSRCGSLLEKAENEQTG